MRVELPSGTKAELAEPAGEATRGVVVAPDVGGLRTDFDVLCARLASDYGWAVLAPEPYAGRESLAVEERLAAAESLVDQKQIGDLLAAADRLGCDRTAVLGFCMGGMYALKASGTGRFDRVVSFYGMIRVPEAWRGPGQGEPLVELAKPGRAPVLAIIGGQDRWTPPADVDDLRKLPDVEVVVYPDAEHGFVHVPSRPSHRPDDAADAWRRTAEFLA